MLMLLQDPYDEVPLPRAPLVLALCQIRYPTAPVLESEDVAQRVHSRLREHFPVVRPEVQQRLNVQAGPRRVAAQQGQSTAWRFETVDQSWWVNLTRDFVALSTRQYESRTGFLEWLGVVIDALMPEEAIVVHDRVGVRYIDLVDEPAILGELGEFVNPHLLGTLALEGAEDRVALVHSIADSVLQVGQNERLRVRTGVVPPNAQIDPGVELTSNPAWFLDIDAFSERTSEFTTDSVIEGAQQLASVGYQMFRWATTDQFIKFYGGVT